jgi:hypothetical protein
MSDTLNEYNYNTCFSVPVEGRCNVNTTDDEGNHLNCKWGYIGNRSNKSCFPDEDKFTTCFSAPDSNKCKRDVNGKKCLWGTLPNRHTPSCYPVDFTNTSYIEVKNAHITINNKSIMNTVEVNIDPKHHNEIETRLNLEEGHI